MARSYGGFLIQFDERSRASSVRTASDSPNAQFSDALSVLDWELRQWEVCGLLFEPNAITHWALARRGKRVATSKARVDFTAIVRVASPIPLAALEPHMPPAFRQRIMRVSSGGGGRLTQKAWEVLTRVIAMVDPVSADAIERLERLRAQSREGVSDRPGAHVVAQERDAVGVALDAFDETGELRRAVLQGWSPPESGLRSFLADVPRVKALEDHHIARDAVAFPNFDASSLTLVSCVFRVAGRQLEVFNVNRTAVEGSLGVDLVYHNARFNAWTLVQYKCMTRDDAQQRDVYRPDRQFDEEIGRMNAFRARIRDDWDRTEAAFRLHGDGFFFKFCRRAELAVMSDVLLPGMYVPREYIDAALDGGANRGPRGGRLISYENTPRYLTNTLFAALVRDGWIGTRAVSSVQIGEIIRDGLSAGRGLVIGRARASAEPVALDETLGELGLSPRVQSHTRPPAPSDRTRILE